LWPSTAGFMPGPPTASAPARTWGSKSWSQASRIAAEAQRTSPTRSPSRTAGAPGDVTHRSPGLPGARSARKATADPSREKANDWTRLPTRTARPSLAAPA
jgi:hypothetical protein